MLYPMYSIKDLKANDFAIPRADLNEACARRFFAMQVNAPDNFLNFAPSDFEMYYVGQFDSGLGVFIPCSMPEFICRGSDLVGAK